MLNTKERRYGVYARSPLLFLVFILIDVFPWFKALVMNYFGYNQELYKHIREKRWTVECNRVIKLCLRESRKKNDLLRKLTSSRMVRSAASSMPNGMRSGKGQATSKSWKSPSTGLFPFPKTWKTSCVGWKPRGMKSSVESIFHSVLPVRSDSPVQRRWVKPTPRKS